VDFVELLLKEITIEGFKSFRDRTTLKFDGPFTAIVGPNGSGKSNVVDAIKWVLGDPSPRSIRAQSGLEAIYNPGEENGGTPAGFASVILKVDNTDSEIPDEPSEWEIERRYYRSGESVYSLNGKTARLKDVRGVMSRKGFGLGSLSVVSQGEVDGFLSLVPTDRRLVFEDLARISDFKANKRKILGQLDDCARNMERLRDLVGELNVRADELTGQANAARRHNELVAEVTDIKAKLAAQEYILALRNIERNEKLLEEIREELADAKTSETDCEKKIVELKKELHDAREAVRTTLEECERGRRELDRAVGEEKRLQESEGHLSRLIESLEGEISERETRQGRLTERKRELLETIGNARNETESASRWKLQYDNYLSRLIGRTRAWELARERLMSKIEKLQGEGSLFQKDEKFYLDMANGVQGEIVGLDHRKLEVLEELKNNGVREFEIAGQLDDVTSKASELRVAQEELSGNLKLKKDTIGKIKDDLSNAESSISLLTREKELLRELEESREGYDEGVVTLMEESENLSGVRGILGELIEVDSGYERTVEMLLGEKLKWLVVEKLSDAASILHKAREDELGRLKCIVLELIPGGEFSSGEINTHIRADGEISRLTGYLTSNFARGNSLDENLDLKKVTLISDGTLFSPPAYVSGGEKSTDNTGILTRRARLVEIGNEVIRLELEMAKLSEEHEIMSGEIEKLDAVHESNGFDLIEYENRIERIKGDQSRLVEKRTELSAEIEKIDSSLEEQNEKHRSCLESANLAKISFQTIGKIRRDTEIALEQLGKQLEGAGGRIEDLRTRLQRCLVIEASYSEEADRAEKEISRIDDEYKSDLELIEKKRGRIQQAKNDLRANSDEYRQACEKREELEKLVPDYETKEREASGKITDCENRIANAENSRDEAREKVTETNERVHNQEVKVAELKGSLSGLEKGLEEFPDFAMKIKSGEVQGKDIPSRKELTTKLDEINLEMDEIGEVNPLAIEEEKHVRLRLDELAREKDDLVKAEDELRKALEEVEKESIKAFVTTFDEARNKFADVFAELFPGGQGRISLTDPDYPLESGIDVKVRFPGKGELDLLQFSGGERALIALAMLFAILKVKPSSFTLLDEVEAALDDVNTTKFLDYLNREFDERQFIMITHNKISMERANRLYGVTMRGGGVSQVVSVDLKKLQEEGVEEVLGTA
jgi:chromosome segregation protein